MVPHPRVVAHPRAADSMTLRRSPRMAALRNDIKYEVDTLSRNTWTQTGKRRSTTQEDMLAAVSQLKVTAAQLSQRKFPIESLSYVLYKGTGELMEYQSLTKNPKYRPLYRNYYAK